MKKFTLTVDGITKKEYFQACQETGRPLMGLLAALMVLICGAIILATGNARPAAFIGPVVVYLVVVVGYWLLMRLSYKDQLSVIDPPVVYTFEAGKWTVTKGDYTAELLWHHTPKLHGSRDCLFIYNEPGSGNLLPRRLLTPEQIGAIETWYKNARPQAKAFFKEQERQERKAYRERRRRSRRR